MCRKAEFAIWVAITYGMLMTQKYAYCVKSEIGITAEMIEARGYGACRLSACGGRQQRPVHAKAMPVMLTTPANFDAWLSVETEEALNLQRPLPVEKIKIVAKGDR